MKPKKALTEIVHENNSVFQIAYFYPDTVSDWWILWRGQSPISAFTLLVWTWFLAFSCP